MSTNAYTRLRALLPPAPLLLGEVIAHNADGTSTIKLAGGAVDQQYQPGVSVGPTMRARGTTVPVGQNAYVRNGVVESQAPAGAIVEAVIGRVVAEPFGPERLALGAAIDGGTAAMGVAYSLDLSPNWTGGYNPRAYTLTAGTLPTGLTLNAATGVISGTRTVAGTASGLVVTCTDTTGRAVPSAAFSIA